MATEKDHEFVRFLLDSTKKGKTLWEATAERNEFAASLHGKYTVLVASPTSYPHLVLVDDAGQELVSVDSITFPEVGELYEFVRRKALNVDSVLTDIMRGEQK